MKISNFKFQINQIIAPLAIILFAVLLRLLPHPANVAPIAALALFGGAYLDKKYALFLPLCALLVSDFFLGFHQSMPFVYGSFVLASIIGMFLKKQKTVARVIIASITSSVLFFLITNFGYWLTESLYPKTFAGQMQAYYYALPFFRNTLLGDLFYTGIFFGGYEIMLRFFYLKKPAPKHV